MAPLFGPEPVKVDQELEAMIRVQAARQKKKNYGHGIPTWSPYHNASKQRPNDGKTREVLPLEYREIPKQDLVWQLDALRGTGLSAGNAPMGTSLSAVEMANEMRGTVGGSPHWSPYYRSPTKMELRAQKLKAKRAARLARKERRQKGLAEDPNGVKKIDAADIDLSWGEMLNKVTESIFTNPGKTYDENAQGDSLRTRRPVAPPKGQVPHYLRPKDEFTPWVEPSWQKKIFRRPQSASYISRTEIEARCISSRLELARKQIKSAEKAKRKKMPSPSLTNSQTLDRLYRRAEDLEACAVRTTLRMITAGIRDRQEKEKRTQTAPGGLRATMRRPLKDVLDPSTTGLGKTLNLGSIPTTKKGEVTKPVTSPIQR